MLFAATYPERVTSLVLYGTFASGRVLGNEMWRRFEEAVEQWGSGMTATISPPPVPTRRCGAGWRACLSAPRPARAWLGRC